MKIKLIILLFLMSNFFCSQEFASFDQNNLQKIESDEPLEYLSKLFFIPIRPKPLDIAALQEAVDYDKDHLEKKIGESGEL